MNLYERWLTTVRERGSESAIFEEGKTSTFRELQGRVEAEPVAAHPVLLQGRTSEFIVQMLRSWRDGQIAVPVEDDAAFNASAAELGEAPSNTIHVKTTSGSTGEPRHILFTAEQLAADADQIVSTMGLRPEWPNIGVISLAHSYGFSNLALPLALHGIPLVLAANPLPESMRWALNQVDCATLPGVPAMWKSWQSAGILGSKIKRAISAGAPLSPQLELEIYEASGFKVHNFLGASECGGIAYDRSDVPRPLDTTFIGEALDGVELSVEETLQVRSRAVGETYWPKAELELSGGCFRTSDLVSLNDGKVHLLGRSDDVMNLAGRKVHPAEIEKIIGEITGVRHCVVFGVPSERGGRTDEIAVCVHLEDHIDLTAVRDTAGSQLPRWKFPRHWRETQALVPDARGKISRARWRGSFQRGEL